MYGSIIAGITVNGDYIVLSVYKDFGRVRVDWRPCSFGKLP